MSTKYPHITLTPEEVGKRFAMYRKLAGLSVGQAAMLAKVERAEVEKTEDGRFEQVTAHLIIELAGIYHCQVAEFLNPMLDERNPLIVLNWLAEGEISEGMAAHMLCGGDRLALRTLQEQVAQEEVSNHE